MKIRALGFGKKPAAKIVVVGLDNSGKTTILNHLKTDKTKTESSDIVPTGKNLNYSNSLFFGGMTFRDNNIRKVIWQRGMTHRETHVRFEFSFSTRENLPIWRQSLHQSSKQKICFF